MTDSILIIGGGVAGLTAALECTTAGARAIVVERDAVVGGRLAAGMTSKSSVGESIDGVPIPKIASLEANQAIEILTMADVLSLDGRPGNFEVAICQRQRFVTDDCTRCNHCRPVCPVTLPNEHDAGLSYRKAIYTPLSETLPQAFVIDVNACLNKPPNYLPCNRCIEVCDDNAIFFDLPLERQHRRQVGAVVIATGFDTVIDPSAAESGYGSHPDIVSAWEMERLLTSPGPTGGYAAKPSNEEYPERILYMIGDTSVFGLDTAVSQINRLAAQDIVTEILIAAQADKVGFEKLDGLPATSAVHTGVLQKVEADDDNRLTVTWADLESSKVPKAAYDMLVLCADTRPAEGLGALAGTLGVDLAQSGYVARPDAVNATATTGPGIYVAGGASGPATLADAVAQARSAAAAALSHIDPRLLSESQQASGPVETKEGTIVLTPDELRERIQRAILSLMETGDKVD